MQTYAATVLWKRRPGEVFIDNRYSRGHRWTFDCGVDVPASASPHVVPLPLSVEAAVDPEEAFVASIASCHMLWFLSIAAGRRLTVESYTDNAEGVLARNAEGLLAMTDVLLRPVVTFSGDSIPSQELIDDIHHLAHEQCFIAASVKTRIRIGR